MMISNDSHVWDYQALKISKLIPDFTLVTCGEIWDEHGNFQPLYYMYQRTQNHDVHPTPAPLLPSASFITPMSIAS